MTLNEIKDIQLKNEITGIIFGQEYDQLDVTVGLIPFLGTNQSTSQEIDTFNRKFWLSMVWQAYFM